MGFFSIENLQKVWTLWEVRSLILFSLFLQFFLAFASPHRKRIANRIFIGLMWLAYLLADWVAAFVVGIMSHRQGDASVDMRSGLMAFWAPFLINHLGGPDNITAFALEDNELWLRHLLQLIAQFAITGYIFFKSLPDNELWMPTIMVFVVGLIKYGERTTSLYHASANKFRKSLLEKYKERRKKMIRARTIGSDNINNYYYCYYYIERVKGLIADIIYMDEDLERSATNFMFLNAKEAFEVVEIELNLMQEALYTKMAVIRGPVGYIIRLVCFVLIFVSFWLWYSKDKSPYHKSDVKITYTLLGGAIVLDATAFIRLICSARRISQIKSNVGKHWLPVEINSAYEIRNTNCFLRVLAPVLPKHKPFFHRRWSESIQGFNLIDYCANARNQNVEKLYEQLGLKDFADGIEYVYESSLSVKLRESIFSQLKNAATEEHSASSDPETKCQKELVQEKLSWIRGVGYDDSLVIWHIATELLRYYSTVGSGDDVCKDDREISKTLSDYMLYLWLRQPKMMAGVVGTNEFKYTNTIDQAKMLSPSKRWKSKDREQLHRDVCDNVLNSTYGGKSALIPARKLARDLNEIKDQKYAWEAVKEVWIDMLSYAAGKCSRNAHAAQLGKGGQLITVVWLMMVHLRLSQGFIAYLDEADPPFHWAI